MVVLELANEIKLIVLKLKKEWITQAWEIKTHDWI